MKFVNKYKKTFSLKKLIIDENYICSVSYYICIYIFYELYIEVNLDYCTYYFKFLTEIYSFQLRAGPEFKKKKIYTKLPNGVKQLIVAVVFPRICLILLDVPSSSKEEEKYI